MSASYLLVGIGEERYALSVEDVLEVGRVGDPAPLPGGPVGVAGLQSLRGEIMPLLDLAVLIGGAPGGRGDAMVVVEADGRRAALVVDTLFDVAPLEETVTDREEAAPLRASVLTDGALVGVLDTRALLDAVEPEAAP